MKSIKNPPFEQCLDDFWQFINNRQLAWWHRYGENATVYSHDDIIASTRFTNIFRTLDFGTRFLSWRVLENATSLEDAVFRVVLYRAFNKTDTWELLDDPHIDSIDMRSYSELVIGRDAPLLGGAYQLHACVRLNAGVHNEGDVWKSRVVLAQELRDHISVVVRRLQEALDVRDAFEAICDITPSVYITPFHAFQLLQDLSYSYKSYSGVVSHLPICNWSHCGPGAEKALSLLGSRIPTPLSAIRHLQTMADELLVAPVPLDNNDQAVKVTAMDIEQALCEYGKYCRAKDGGSAKSVRRRDNNILPPVPAFQRMPVSVITPSKPVDNSISLMEGMPAYFM